VTELRIVRAKGGPYARGVTIGHELRDLINESVDFYHRYLHRRAGGNGGHRGRNVALYYSPGARRGTLLMLRKRKAAKQGKITVHAPVRRRYTESKHP